MFDEVCSIYADAHDNYGRYVDMETGECIQQMTIREFCLTDRWKPYVLDLRYLIEVFGSKAKDVTWKHVCEEGLAERYQMYYERMVEDILNHRRREDTDADIEKRIEEGSIYAATKKSLPGATLSGLLAIWEDECKRKDGSIFIAPVSRRETHLLQHTGWLVIDIDLGDNASLSNFANIRAVLEDRPEVALLMRSCSGTGFFGLVHLTNPAFPPSDGERYSLKELIRWHKAQFRALRKEYQPYGVNIDASCSNIGRVRFASWDDPEHIYINERAVAYTRFDYGNDAKLVPKDQSLTPRQNSTFSPNGNYSVPLQNGGGWGSFWEDPRVQDRLVELCVQVLSSRNINITESYDEWCKAGWALKGHPNGERLFHELSACSKKYNASQTSLKWLQLGQSNTVTGNYLIHLAKQSLGEGVYRDLCRQVRQEMK